MGLNCVAVGDVSRTMTQGSSCLATLGSGTESRWDSRTERDSASSASRRRIASTEMFGCFRRNIACGTAAGRRPALHFPRFRGWWEYQDAQRLTELNNQKTPRSNLAQFLSVARREYSQRRVNGHARFRSRKSFETKPSPVGAQDD